jgi:cytochrome c551/c552
MATMTWKKENGTHFQGISKYKGDKTAEAMLADSIQKGVKDKWGKIPMPAQKIPPADAQALSKWILTL